MNPESRSMLPKMAFTGFISRYREPKVEEGFQDITSVDFKVLDVHSYALHRLTNCWFDSWRAAMNRRCNGQSSGSRKQTWTDLGNPSSLGRLRDSGISDNVPRCECGGSSGLWA